MLALQISAVPLAAALGRVAEFAIIVSIAAFVVMMLVTHVPSVAMSKLAEFRSRVRAPRALDASRMALGHGQARSR